MIGDELSFAMIRYSGRGKELFVAGFDMDGT
jgi:hypothetical protein